MKELNDKKISEIDISSFGEMINEPQFRGYFLGKEGQEHYKLLAYFSTLFENQVLLDIGTYKGCSALALSYNQKNKVKSFDLGNFRGINSKPNNVEFILDDFTDDKYKELVLKSPLILLITS